MADDEFALRRAMERATQAQQALENPILIEAFKLYEEKLDAAWKATAWHDDAGRKSLWQAGHILGKVKTHLQMTVASGQLSARQIERDFTNPRRFGIV